MASELAPLYAEAGVREEPILLHRPQSRAEPRARGGQGATQRLPRAGPSAAVSIALFFVLGRRFEKKTEWVPKPSLRRLGSFTVTSWLPDSFTICKRITSDTPVEYHQMDDLRFGPATADLLPKQMRASRQVAAMAAKKEGDGTRKDLLVPIALAAKKGGSHGLRCWHSAQEGARRPPGR